MRLGWDPALVDRYLPHYLRSIEKMEAAFLCSELCHKIGGAALAKPTRAAVALAG